MVCLYEEQFSRQCLVLEQGSRAHADRDSNWVEAGAAGTEGPGWRPSSGKSLSLCTQTPLDHNLTRHCTELTECS